MLCLLAEKLYSFTPLTLKDIDLEFAHPHVTYSRERRVMSLLFGIFDSKVEGKEFTTRF